MPIILFSPLTQTRVEFLAFAPLMPCHLTLFEEFPTQLPAPSYHAPPPPHRPFFPLAHSLLGSASVVVRRARVFPGGDSAMLNMTQHALDSTISLGIVTHLAIVDLDEV